LCKPLGDVLRLLLGGLGWIFLARVVRVVRVFVKPLMP